ncbi:tetratricopeptide repeat protein [Novipirellula artificiosorum]|uniref:Tetratricopeptide repeat protein n=1 Tax=Novipirellula artificiosorum TaxID=2528016 RepID=A0A5C6E4A6_9BACT|nr:tetratricopeptide repeat protein [Novipirellula artificiosorum]TWU42049.1 tetratricopeptide repeat protein [Novipirellula artificiosorum]
MTGQTNTLRSACRLHVRFAILSIGGLLLVGFSGCQWAAGGQNAQGARLYEQGQYTGALQQFQKVIETDPQNADGYYNLAATTHRIGNQRGQAELLEQAESLYNQCLDHDPNHVECHRGLAVLLMDTGRTDRSFALMKNWASQNPNYAEPRIELARLYEEAGDPTTALKYLEDSVQIDANNARAWLALGRLREQSGDLPQALRNYQHSLAINNMQPEAAARVAAINQQLNAVPMQQPGAAANGTSQIAAQPSVGFDSGFIRR